MARKAVQTQHIAEVFEERAALDVFAVDGARCRACFKLGTRGARAAAPKEIKSEGTVELAP